MIGADFFDHGGSAQKPRSESSNYLTGDRVTKKPRGGEVKSKFKPETIYMDDADWDVLEGAAFARSG